MSYATKYPLLEQLERHRQRLENQSPASAPSQPASGGTQEDATLPSNSNAAGKGRGQRNRPQPNLNQDRGTGGKANHLRDPPDAPAANVNDTTASGGPPMTSTDKGGSRPESSPDVSNANGPSTAHRRGANSSRGRGGHSRGRGRGGMQQVLNNQMIRIRMC